MKKIKDTKWKKQELHFVSKEMQRYYIRTSSIKWIEIPESKWLYKETKDYVLFAPRGLYLATLSKRLPPLTAITVLPDEMTVNILRPRHYYVLVMLEEYVRDLQENRKTKGIFDVENTPHIFN